MKTYIFIVPSRLIYNMAWIEILEGLLRITVTSGHNFFICIIGRSVYLSTVP